MRTFLLSLIAMLAGCIGVSAQPRSEGDAQRIARDFLGKTVQTRGLASPSAQGLTLVPSSRIYALLHPEAAAQTRSEATELGFYVFSDEQNKRFVIVSGDERQYDVLGYSENAPFDTEAIPCGMKSMLLDFAAEYEYLSNSSLTTASVAKGIQKVTAYTGGILQTKWGQGTPFNKYCPLESGKNCKTGCVATAMAQVMYRYKNPASYSWANMKTDYSSSYTAAQADAVARLMADCGAAVNMKYGVSGSSAPSQDIGHALSYKFGFNKKIQFYQKKYFSEIEWQKKVDVELSNNRPVIYSGYGSGGHAFVIDGRDTNGYYHVNWGWSGQGVNPDYNNTSYFLLTSLKPKENGTTHDYTTYHEMICYISPNTVGVEGHNWVADKFNIGNQQTSFKVGATTTYAFTNLWCHCTEANTFENGGTCTCNIAVYAINVKSTTNKWTSLTDAKKVQDVLFDYGYKTMSGNLTFRSDVFSQDGEYYIKPMTVGTYLMPILTLGGQTDYYLATVKNGTVTLKPSSKIAAKYYVTKITLDVANISLPIGRSVLLVEDIEPAYATDRSVVWKSSNTNVAKVDNKGNVTAVAEGEATITCMANDGSNVTATCKVKAVTPNISITDVVCDNLAPGFLTQKDKLKFHATITNSGETVDDQILTELAVMDKDTKKFIKYSARDIRGYKKGQKVTIDYELALTDVPDGQYVATVLYYDSWDKGNWIYFSKNLVDVNIAAGNEVPNIKISSLTFENANLGQLTQNDKLVCHAALKNSGGTCDVPMCLAVLNEDKTIITNTKVITREVKKNETVNLDFELPLTSVSQGRYYATVLYQKSWEGSKGWYYNTSWLKEIVLQSSLPGDVNGDGVVNLADISTLAKIIAGKTSATPNADVNADGKISIADIIAVTNKMVTGK